ncbi:MAG: hypothetical protein ACRBFS_21605 [Aureispira sp.]
MNNTTKNILLVLLIVVILATGIFAVRKVLKGKDPSDEQESTGSDAAPVGGNKADYGFTAEQLNHDTIIRSGEQPTYQAEMEHSAEGQRLIQQEMQRIQTEKDVGLAEIRQKHQIGKYLFTTAELGVKGNEVVRKAISKLQNVDINNYDTYPIYGKYQAKGKLLRADLERFVNRPKKEQYRYNFTKYRHWDKEWWWFGSVRLNIMLFTTDAHLPSNDNVWFSKVDRKGMDNFKAVNGHKKASDQDLLKFWRNDMIKGVFNAFGAVAFCKAWLAELDRLDQMTYNTAVSNLVFLGRLLQQETQTATNSKPINVSTKGGAIKKG